MNRAPHSPGEYFQPTEEVRVAPVDPTSPAAAELIAALDAYQLALYPAESVHLIPADCLRSDGVTFLGAFLGDRLIGCGAYVNHGGEYAELKRMFVRPEARGLGVGRRLLGALEDHARSMGLTLIRLETGVSQPEALRLYERGGYARRGRFGDYPDDPLSVFMEKRLDA
jgi:putative acetyltransferase